MIMPLRPIRRTGQPPFDAVMMTALLLYSDCCGIYASPRIAKACRERVDFHERCGVRCAGISVPSRSFAGGV
jgi:hypothetical protein